MRILLDAYFDNNFGDDLFVSTVLERYQQALFYVFWRNPHPRVLTQALEHPNLVLLPEGCCANTLLPFDGYIMIGGDVLPDGVDYTRRIEGMRHVKNNGGFVSMLGFSLYEHYGKKTRQDLAVMASLADSIVPRDQASADRFRELVPTARITPSTDMAFTGNYGTAAGGRDILGIAPRRKLYSTDQEHDDFCTAMAALADGWLTAHPAGTVRFLALSTGEYDDKAVSEDILRKMQNPGAARILCHGTDDLIDAFRECTALVPTRFHALVFALIFRIPFVPVPYEVKLTQLLDELGYAGPRIPYGAPVDGAAIAEALEALDRFAIEEDKLAAYLQKAAVFFPETDRLMSQRCNAPAALPQLPACPTAAALESAQIENAQLTRDKDYLIRQIAELNGWVQQLQQQKQAFEQELSQVNALRESLATQLTATVENYAALDARFQETENLRQQQLAQLHQTTADYAALDARSAEQATQIAEQAAQIAEQAAQIAEQAAKIEAQNAQITELTPLADKYRRICEKIPFVDKMLK